MSAIDLQINAITFDSCAGDASPYCLIPESQRVIVGENKQYLINGEMVIDGEFTIEGEAVITGN